MESEFKTKKDKLKSVHPNHESPMACACCLSLFVGLFFVLLFCNRSSLRNKFYDLKIVSMDFTAELDNNSSHLTLSGARWDMLIRVPGKLDSYHLCLQGTTLQASFLYKNLNLVTSSMQSYNRLKLGVPQLLKASVVATREYLSGVVGKEIIEAIKERNEVWFGSRLSLTDCREETKKGMMSYECEEAKLRFEPGSQIKVSTAFEDHPTCIINL